MNCTENNINNGTLRGALTWRTNILNPYAHPVRDRVRAACLAVLLRMTLRLGFVIVLIGRCRSGKTYLLQRFLAGKIIDHSGFWRESGKRPLFNTADMPNGPFAVDEIAAFEPRSLFNGVRALSHNGRSFALAAQCVRDLDEANIGMALMGRCVLVFSLDPSQC